QSTSQIANNTRNDNKIPIEISSTGESIIVNGIDDHNNNNPNLHEASDVSLDASIEVKSDTELKVEQDTGDIVRVLQTQISDLQTKCSRFEELANEGLMWKEKTIQLQLELEKSESNEMKIIKGKTEIEFGSELLPLTVEYNPQTNQFSAWIPQEVIKRVIAVLRR
ncbi:MAG: hypothetical protein ACRD5J_19535, partial [Nitrososphaeraceae archaeon]